jgi:hypothetical protein
LALTAPKASAERMPANDVTTLANVLRSAFHAKANLESNFLIKWSIERNIKKELGYTFEEAWR